METLKTKSQMIERIAELSKENAILKELIKKDHPDICVIEGFDTKIYLYCDDIPKSEVNGEIKIYKMRGEG